MLPGEIRMESAQTYLIQGRTVRMPVEVRDASTGVATYLVSASVAQSLIPDGDFEVAHALPGRTPLALAVIDYRDNDLGDYNEVSITLFVRRRGAARGVPYLSTWIDWLRGRLGTYIYRLPVNQSFTCEAGRTIWGFPKTVETIDFETHPNRVRCRLSMDGAHVLTLDLPRGGSRAMPETEITTYTHIEGVAHATRAVQQGSGLGFSLGGTSLQLGAHPLAETLRRLGLPRRAIACMWIEHLRARFEAPIKL